MKNILFLSDSDFKAKSIQVIRKTPEAYYKRQWSVNYIVGRDYCKYGNYFYEDIINPEGVNVQRFKIPLTTLRNIIGVSIIQTIVSKISGYLTILLLAFYGAKYLKNNKVDVIYGYEPHGVNALLILKFFGRLDNIRTVSRFQGTWIANYLLNKNYKKLVFNWDDILSLKGKTDLCIMTNDGTQGDYAIQKLNSNNSSVLRFWPNGVDFPELTKEKLFEFREKYKKEGTNIILSISRLESWKRVDRIIYTVASLVNDNNVKNVKYLVVGEGSDRENYEALVRELGITEYVEFVGGVDQRNVNYFLDIADVFVSMYDLSNVGNPLLEALRSNKIIFTLNNGDTSRWIEHKRNGFIYDINQDFVSKAASDMSYLFRNEKFRRSILNNVRLTSNEKLWTWEERFDAEVSEVSKLCMNA